MEEFYDDRQLYFTVGSARCGKSTFSNKWVNEKPNRAIVSSDDIRMALHGNRYISFAEGMVYSIKHVMIRSLLNRGMQVLVDGTHTTRTSVERLLEIDPTAVGIVFDTPLDVCIQRAKDTKQKDLVNVIKRHHNNLEEIYNQYKSYQSFLVSIKKDIQSKWRSDKLPLVIKAPQ